MVHFHSPVRLLVSGNQFRAANGVYPGEWDSVCTGEAMVLGLKVHCVCTVQYQWWWNGTSLFVAEHYNVQPRQQEVEIIIRGKSLSLDGGSSTSHGGDDRNGSGSRHESRVFKLVTAGDAYMSSRERNTGFNFLFVQVYERDKGFILFYV